MGQKTSALKVTSRMTVTGACGTVDAVRLSYGKRSCCGPKRRTVASFSFPRGKWEQLSLQDTLRNNSANVATIHVGKLRGKDGNIPVRVTCLTGKVSVFRSEMSLADLLARLKCTEGEGKAVLSFSLAGGRLEGTEAGHAFTVMFCNGKKLSNGGTEHSLVPPLPHHNNEPENGLMEEVPRDLGVNSRGPQASPLGQDHEEEKQVMEEVMGRENPSQDMTCETQVEDVMGEEDPSLDDEWTTEDEEVMDGESPSLNEQFVQEKEEVMGEEDPSLDVGWETEKEEVMGEEDPSLDAGWETEEEVVMGEEDPSLDAGWEREEVIERAQKEPKEQIARHRGRRSRRNPPSLTRDDNISKSQGPVRGSLWDHVASCAAGVALGFMVFAWIEANTYW